MLGLMGLYHSGAGFIRASRTPRDLHKCLIGALACTHIPARKAEITVNDTYKGQMRKIMSFHYHLRTD